MSGRHVAGNNPRIDRTANRMRLSFGQTPYRGKQHTLHAKQDNRARPARQSGCGLPTGRNDKTRRRTSIARGAATVLDTLYSDRWFRFTEKFQDRIPDKFRNGFNVFGQVGGGGFGFFRFRFLRSRFDSYLFREMVAYCAESENLLSCFATKSQRDKLSPSPP